MAHKKRPLALVAPSIEGQSIRLLYSSRIARHTLLVRCCEIVIRVLGLHRRMSYYYEVAACVICSNNSRPGNCSPGESTFGQSPMPSPLFLAHIQWLDSSLSTHRMRQQPGVDPIVKTQIPAWLRCDSDAHWRRNTAAQRFVQDTIALVIRSH